MAADPQVLESLLGADSDGRAGRLWRGYVAHGLFFYRQNDLGGFAELLRLGEIVPMGRRAKAGRAEAALPAGPGWEPAARALRGGSAVAADRLLSRAMRADPSQAAFPALRGLFRPERYWGSLRLGEKSLADFEAAARLAPEQPWPAFLAGMSEEMRRNYTSARRWLDAAGAAAPRWVWPFILRGICRWYQADFKGSVREFERALELEPDCVPALLFLSRSKSDLRDRSLVGDLDRAAKLAPGSGLVLAWRGRAHFVVERTPESLADLRRASRLLPLYDRTHSWLGISLMESGRSREALPHLSRADALNRYYPTTMYPLARALMDRGDWTRAGSVLRRAAAVDRNGVWVEHRISMNHPNPACVRSLRDLDRFLQARPRAAWALAWRGQTRLILRDYRGAQADLDQAAGLSPKDPWTFLWRGETRRRLGYAGLALADFEAALRLSPRLSYAWAAKGWCLLALRRPAQAREALDRSLRLQPHCAPALAWRGEVLAALGDSASSDMLAAVELRPQYGARPAPTPSWNAADAAAAFSREVLAAYCRERESADCLRAFESGEFSDALRLCKPPAVPGEIRSFLFRGWLRLANADAAGAVEEASWALDDGLDPSCAPALLLRARAKRALGQTEAAGEDEARLVRLTSAASEAPAAL